MLSEACRLEDGALRVLFSISWGESSGPSSPGEIDSCPVNNVSPCRTLNSRWSGDGWRTLSTLMFSKASFSEVIADVFPSWHAPDQPAVFVEVCRPAGDQVLQDW